MFLSDISIKRPVMISMFIIVFVLFGALAYFGMNLETTPSIDLPFVTVQTIYPGASPEDLEILISKKIEDEVASISQIDYIQSYSMESVSYVMIAFELDKDVYLALQEVKDKVDGIVNEMPVDADPPIVRRYDPTASSVVEVILSGPLSATELYQLADQTLTPRFSQVDGVANVSITGGREREIHIELDSRIVKQQNISMAQLAQILAIQNMDMPGGNFQQRDQDYTVRLEGEFNDVNAIRDLEIPTAHGSKRLGDLANIQDTGEDVRERTTYFNVKENKQDDNVILMSLMKTSDGNAVNIYKAIEKSLPEIEKTLPAGCELNIATENASFTEATVADTLTNIGLGIILTSLILLFFLHDYKSTIIVAVSMPVSLISAFLLMKQSGYTLNIMSLMGMSTAVGILVTNSVVVLENIFRHKNMGNSNKESAAIGTSEITMAVLASAGTNLVVFLPLATMSSIVGRFFVQFSMTVVFATIFSILVSFTLTPMMASLILPEHDRKKHPIGEKLEKMFSAWECAYQRILKSLLTNKLRGGLVLLISIVLLVISLVVAGTLGFEFTPTMDEGLISIKTELPNGYTLQETAKVMQEIENRVKSYDEVSHLWTQLGRQSETDIGTNLANLQVKLLDKKDRKRSTADIVQAMIYDFANIPNVRIAVSSIASMGSGRSDVEFTLQGLNLDSLQVYAGELEKAIKNIPGVINLNTSAGSGKPEVTLSPNRSKMADAGITVYDLAMAIRSSVAGLAATQYKEAGEEYDILVTLSDSDVDSPEDIGAIPVVGPMGTYRIEQLADIKITEGFSTILHKDRSKAISFTCDVGTGYVMGDIMNEIDKLVAAMNLPSGYSANYGGMSEEMQSAVKSIGQAFLIALILTYMLLAAILESLTQPLLILGTIPLALIGVFFGLAATGLSMNIVSMLAIVMLVGIVVNNAILLLDYTNQLVRQKGYSVHDALIEACPTKLKPIIMSSLAIILGMLPMALGLGSSGAEMRQPMGIVSIGGLIASTLLSLIVIPVLYNVVTKKQLARKKQAKNSES